MFKKPIYLALFVFINLGFLLLAYEGQTQGVISLPWTGQSKCYDSSGTEISCTGTGQDGELQVGVEWPDLRFTVSGDCVTDNLTGLMWAKNANLAGGKRSWQGALDYVTSMNSGSGLCGYHDWRLPNVNELESLINSGEADTAWLNSQGFSNVQSNYYWSSTTDAVNTDNAWVVSVWNGDVYGYSKSYGYYVWPVRSGQSGTFVPSDIWKTGQTTSYATGDDGALEKGVAWPPQRFTDHGDGTVTDNLTGLMWAKNANLAGGAKTWQEALDYVKSINSGAGLGGYHDWRLPNRKELFSLIDHSKWDPALPVSHPFQNVRYDYYWSSTTYAYITGTAWVVAMWYGIVRDYYKSSHVRVWPVRSGQGPFGYPDISVTPNPVPFGSVNTGAASDQTVTIKNDGNANLVVGAITQPGQPFSKIQDNCSGQTIAPNATCTVMYRFAPTTSGNFSNNSNIPSNDPDENPVTVTLNGTGSTAPSLTVSKSGAGTGTVTSSPAGINCGDDCSETYNQGTSVTLTARPASGSTFGGWSGACSGTGTCTVTMNAAMSVTATFDLQAAGNTLTVVKSGTGTGTVTSSPAGISCGDDCSETYSKVQKVKLTAKADANSAFTGWSGGGCSGTKTCTVTVDAAITVTASFALKTPDISVAQTSIEFGSAKVGKKVTKTLKIANNGTGDLVITLFGLEGTDFSIQGSSSVTIKGKKSYTLKVLFTPKSAGFETANLEVSSNDPDTPTIDISLSGTGQ